jgi:hypothetical protein
MEKRVSFLAMEQKLGRYGELAKRAYHRSIAATKQQFKIEKRHPDSPFNVWRVDHAKLRLTETWNDTLREMWAKKWETLRKRRP